MLSISGLQRKSSKNLAYLKQRSAASFGIQIALVMSQRLPYMLKMEGRSEIYEINSLQMWRDFQSGGKQLLQLC
jgi:hypothetical protein